MNSSAVPSHPETAARTRSAMLRWAVGGRSVAWESGVWAVVIIFLVICCGGWDSERSELKQDFGRCRCVSGDGEGVHRVGCWDDVGDDRVETIGSGEHRDGVVDLGGERECAAQAELLGQHRPH